LILEDLIERAEYLEGEIAKLVAARDIHALKLEVAGAEARLKEAERQLAYRNLHPIDAPIPLWARRTFGLAILGGIAWAIVLVWLRS
jgi:hypothetical protein